MQNIKKFIFILTLFALPIIACGVFQQATPHLQVTIAREPTKSPVATSTASKSTKLSPTQAARRTALALTQTVDTETTKTIEITDISTSTNAPRLTRTPRRSATPTITLTPTPEFPRIDYINIPAPALANNILNESLERDLAIYLPASYGDNETRYPVAYYLLDLGLTGRDVTITAQEIQKDVAAELSREMILVIISGNNSLGGSLYVNSPVTGNWDDFITKDVVRYVDERYRSIPNPASRGLGGYGVGGFGAVNIAMRHPDVFSTVYAISPYLFDDDGLAASPLFDSPLTIDAVIDLQARELPMSTREAISDMQHAGKAQFSIAYGVSFFPNLSIPAPFIDYPYYRQNGRVFRDEAIWQRWQTGFGGLPEKIQQYKTNLLQLHAIGLGCGEHPPYQWILTGCQFFSTKLTAAGISNQLSSFPAGIEPSLDQGIRAFMLPFFSAQLTFNP